jgi:hypothetical protein
MVYPLCKHTLSTVDKGQHLLKDKHPMLSLKVLTTKLHNKRRNTSRQPLIAVSRSLYITSLHPAVDRECSSINHADDTKNANQNIYDPRGSAACNGAVVKHRLFVILVERIRLG